MLNLRKYSTTFCLKKCATSLQTFGGDTRLPFVNLYSQRLGGCAPVLASVTCAVKLDAPGFVGVPLITPVFWFNDKPLGRDPMTIDHVYGCVPPLAASCGCGCGGGGSGGTE